MPYTLSLYSLVCGTRPATPVSDTSGVWGTAACARALVAANYTDCICHYLVVVRSTTVDGLPISWLDASAQ